MYCALACDVCFSPQILRKSLCQQSQQHFMTKYCNEAWTGSNGNSVTVQKVMCSHLGCARRGGGGGGAGKLF